MIIVVGIFVMFFIICCAVIRYIITVSDFGESSLYLTDEEIEEVCKEYNREVWHTR